MIILLFLIYCKVTIKNIIYMNKIILILTIVFIISSCKQDDIIIDNVSANNKYLIFSGNQLIRYTNTNDIENIINDLPDEVKSVKYFRGYYYVLFKTLQSIYVISDKKFDIVSKIDFKGSNMLPYDICFPNATDAYICHSDCNIVTLLDIMNFQLSNYKIEVAKKPVYIAGIGNQVYVCCQDDDAIIVIDTRLNEVVDTINVASKPRFIDIDVNNEKLFIISKGDDKSSITFQSFSLQNRELLNKFNIKNSEDVIPASIAVSKKYIYITSDCYLWRISAINEKSAIVVKNKAFIKVKYNPIYEKFYLLSNSENLLNSEITIYNANTSKYISSFNLNIVVDDIIMEYN